MAKKTFPLPHVYRLLEPGPVVLVTTAHGSKANIMTQSWHTMMEFEPPLVGCVISGRNHSFDALIATRECVLNIPAVNLAKQVVGIGNCSGNKVDKFKKFKLTSLPASQVTPPLIAECYANLECKVADTRMVNKYNFFVLEVVKSPFQQVSYPTLDLGADGCKAQRAANGYSIGKWCNVANAAPRPNPKGRLPAGALRRCGLLVENDYTAQPAPCTASRRQTARGMKPAEMDSRAWIDPAKKEPRTLHHRGKGIFMVAGRTIKLPSRMK